MLHYIRRDKVRDQFRMHLLYNPHSFTVKASIDNRIPSDTVSLKHTLCGITLDPINRSHLAICWADGLDDHLLLYLRVKSAGMDHEYAFHSLTDVKYLSEFKASVSVNHLGRVSATITTEDQHATIVTTHDGLIIEPIGCRLYPKLAEPCLISECIISLNWMVGEGGFEPPKT